MVVLIVEDIGYRVENIGNYLFVSFRFEQVN